MHDPQQSNADPARSERPTIEPSEAEPIRANPNAPTKNPSIGGTTPTAQELRVLDGLRLNPRKAFPGRIRGERLTKRKGLSIEFADYRDYTDGDDLRHLDWNVLARLDSPVLKTYQDEEDLAVLVLLDCTSSMDFGDPTKFDEARRLTCAFAYVGLSGFDAVRGYALGTRERPTPYFRRLSSYLRFSAWASAQAVAESTGGSPSDSSESQPARTRQGLSASLRALAASSERVGLTIVLSDGLDPEAPQALRVLAGRGHEIAFVQVLSPLEEDPDLEGDLRLLDAETGAKVEITANEGALREYKRRLREHCGSLESACMRVGGRYEKVLCGEPLGDVFRRFRKKGWAVS